MRITTKLTTILISFIFVQITCAQVNSDLHPQVKSPEVKKFEQYLNQPVNLVSGTPQVTIPVYTLEYGDLKLPITLEYDASGVKVESIASAVGLNWTLNIGGVVSRIVKGAPDEGNPYNWENQSLVDVDGFYQDYGLTKLDSQLNLKPTQDFSPGNVDNRAIEFARWNHDLASGIKDSQPDLFYFSTPEGGSKFVFNDNRQIVYLENTDFIIHENYVAADFKSWNAIAPDGTKYKFGIDNATGYQGRNNAAEASYNLDECPTCGGLGGSVNKFIVNSWFLTEMSDYTNNKKIELTYIDNNYRQIVNNIQSKFSDECQYFNTGNVTVTNAGCITEEGQYTSFAQSPYSFDPFYTPIPGQSAPYIPPANMQGKPTSSHIVHSKLISRIVAGTTQVDFIYSSRNDLLDEFVEANNAGKKLDEIQVSSNGVCIRRFIFNYTETTSNDISNRPAVTQQAKKRFFLTQFKETSCDGANSKPYTFVYNQTPLPNRLSFAQDKWGFFNGKTNNASLFPTYKFFQDPTFYADRNVDLAFAKAGSLEQIIYPTKGSVNFEFESHIAIDPTDYLYNPIPSQTILNIQPNSAGLYSNTFNTNSFVYNLSNSQILSLSCNLMFPNPFHSLGDYCTSNQTAIAAAAEIKDSVTNEIVGSIWYVPNQSTTKRVYLDPSKFIVGRTYIINVYGTECYHNMATIAIHDITPIYDVGGLRLKKVTHKDYDNTIKKEVNYTYFNPKMVSNPQKAHKSDFNHLSNLVSLSGILSDNNINYLNEYGKAEAGYDWDDKLSYFYFISSGVDLYEFNFMGPHITYGKVIETDGNGKIEHNFNSYKSYLELNAGAQIFFPAPPLFQSILAGEKGSDIYWDNNNTDLKTDRYTYNYSTYNTSIKGVSCLSYGSAFGSAGTLLHSFNIQGQIKTLKEETVTNNFNNNMLTTTKEYEYNGNGHYQPTKATITDSYGDVNETLMYYPGDLLSEPFMSDLVAQNRRSTPVKTEVLKNSVKLLEQKTVFANDLFTSSIVQPKSVYAAKFPNNLPYQPLPVNGQLEKKVTSDLYDASGNLLQFTKEDGTPVAIIWGYNQTQPVAKLENMLYSAIPSNIIGTIQTKSNADMDDNSSCVGTSCTEELLRIELNALRTNPLFVNSQITTYTYNPEIGITSITDAKGNKQTYTYDTLGRLKNVKDKDGNVLEENQYHYKN